MVQSFSSLFVHLIFSTKGRQMILSDSIRDSLHSYMGKVLQNLGCTPVLINSVEDHVHLLFSLSRMVAVSKAIQDVKSASSQWMKKQGAPFSEFSWQVGFGVFSVSESDVETVRKYIADQREHHRRVSFQDEYREFMRRHGLEFDEQYGWD